MSGVSKSAITTGELGKHVPNEGTIKRLADTLEVDVAELYDEAPTPEDVLTKATLREVEAGRMGVEDALDVFKRAGLLYERDHEGVVPK
jgi:transcriptional regulator with XRE-family HTH domain